VCTPTSREHPSVGWYERHVVPRIVNVLCASKRMEPLRRRALEDVSGVVLEIGFGSGGNLPVYPAEVERVVAVEPSDVGRELAGKRLEASRVPVEFAGLDGEALPLPDASVDNAVSTWTLCTIPDVVAAVREVRRVLKPGGRFFFLEHGRSPDPKVARNQDRFDGLEQRLAGGCHLNRDIRGIVEQGGLTVEQCDNFYFGIPKAWTYMYAGRAVAE
jgi:ubiquinone/menaquinone biosynthesis C-methylase UbiE